MPHTATPVWRATSRAPGPAGGSLFFRTAILIDGGWMSPAVAKADGLATKYPPAARIHAWALGALAPDESLYRVFYYDSVPFAGSRRDPVTREEVDFSRKGPALARRRFLDEMGRLPHVALRLGELAFNGWKLKRRFQEALLRGGGPCPALTASDIEPNFQQKGVDMRIGVDIATLALKRLVERIILFSADADMLPAIKLARVEGVQVVMANVGRHRVAARLVPDCDEVRDVPPPEEG